MPFSSKSSIQASYEVTIRIVQMFQKGELDTGVAMELLGGAAGRLVGSKKRPLEATSGPSSGACADSQEAEGDDGASLDDLLETAKRAKQETKLNYFWEICCIFFGGQINLKFQTIGSTNVHGSMFGASPICI